MAYSKSIRKGQIPTYCALCETENKINCKCLDCSLLMCTGCKDKVHSKFKNAKFHRIIDIKDVGNNTVDELNFRNIICTEHGGEYCCLYCETCDNVVCPSCIAKFHRKHDLTEISEAFNKKIETMKTIQSQCLDESVKINEQKIRLEKLKTAETAKFKKVKQEILEHGKALKQAVDCYVEKICKELEENHHAILQSINSDLDIIEKTSQEYDDHTSKTNDLLNMIDVTKFFEGVLQVEELAVQSFIPHIKTMYPSTPFYIPGEITQGNVGELKADIDPIEVELSVVEEFQTDLSLISNVCPCSDGSLWISDYTSETLQKVKPKSNTLQILSTDNIRVYGMALTPVNDLLLANGKPGLKQIKSNKGKIKNSIYNMDPFDIVSVHVSKDFEIMVGGYVNNKNDDDDDDDDDNERAVVIVMNQEGEQMTVYEHDKQNQPLFSFPGEITSTTNHKIFVADDDTDNGQVRLVILDQTGDVQYYTGHQEVNREVSFKPVALTTTPKDNVIVVDRKTRTLHIFNNSGQLMTFYNVKDLGIERPISLGFSPSGQLYIGCKTKKDSKDNAKLYLVNISGF